LNEPFRFAVDVEAEFVGEIPIGAARPEQGLAGATEPLEEHRDQA
jgi:hypothetical protein